MYIAFTSPTEYVPSTPTAILEQSRAEDERRQMVESFVREATVSPTQSRDVMQDLRRLMDGNQDLAHRELLITLLDRVEQEDYRRQRGREEMRFNSPPPRPRSRDGDWQVIDEVSIPTQHSNYEWDVTTTTTPQVVPDQVDAMLQQEAMRSLKAEAAYGRDRLVPENTGIAENGEVVMPEGFARGAKLSQDSFFHGAAQCPECNNTFKIGDSDMQLICTQCSHEFERPQRYGDGEKTLGDSAVFHGATVGTILNNPNYSAGLGAVPQGAVIQGNLTVAPGGQLTVAPGENMVVTSADPHNHGMAGNFAGYSPQSINAAYASGSSLGSSSTGSATPHGGTMPNYTASGTSDAVHQKMANLAKSIQAHQSAAKISPLVPFNHTAGQLKAAQIEEIADSMESGPWTHPATGATAKQPPEII